MDGVFVDTARLRTHCWVSGPEKAQPLLLVHGNLSTGRFWQAVAEQLGDRFRVVAPDLRSFGRTEQKPVDASRGLRDWSDDLHALLEALGWNAPGRAHAGGWSMGGGTAGVGPAPSGVNNAMSPKWCDTSAFGDVENPAPVVWIRGTEDQVVSDQSLFDFGTLGKLGAVPGWPGDAVCPSQPMIEQTRTIFERRKAHGGSVSEVVLDGVAHGPVIERPALVAELLSEQAAGRLQPTS